MPLTHPIRNIVSIPDVHGDLARLRSALQLANLTDANHAWRAPAGTVLVQTGDLFDRGDDTKGVVALLQSIEAAADRGGSAVYRVLGNHDVMNLMGDLRYVTSGDVSSFGGWAARAAAFAADGPIGAWLLRGRVCVQVAGIVFVHAGVHPKYASLGCDGIAARGAKELAGAVPRAAGGGLRRERRAPMLEDEEGPVWYRGLAEGTDCGEVRRSLGALGAERMVVGHTIQERGRMRIQCGGALALTDVGMTRGYDGMLGRASRVAVLHALARGGTGGGQLRRAPQSARAPWGLRCGTGAWGRCSAGSFRPGARAHGQRHGAAAARRVPAAAPPRPRRGRRGRRRRRRRPRQRRRLARPRRRHQPRAAAAHRRAAQPADVAPAAARARRPGGRAGRRPLLDA